MQNAPVGGSASQIAAQPVKCDNRTTEQPMDQTDETTSAPEINKQRTVEVKYGITLDTKQMTKLKELRLLHLYASVAIDKSCCHRNTSNLFKHLSLAHPDLFRELRDRQVSASFINSDLILTFIYN